MFNIGMNNWRKVLLLKEGAIIALPEIYVLSPENLKKLRVSEELGAPSFIIRLSKRWCL